jgi:hypothetical protein
MKIVDLQSFASLPAGTVFSIYRSRIFGPLTYKGDDTGAKWNEFFVFDVSEASGSPETERVSPTGAEQPHRIAAVFLADHRCDPDWDRLIAIWDSADVKALIAQASGNHKATELL